MIDTRDGLRSLILDGRQALSDVIMQGTWTNIGVVTLPPFTLGGTVTLGGNVFDAGAGGAEIDTTGNGAGLTIESTQDGNRGGYLILKHTTADPAVGDAPGRFYIEGIDGAGAPGIWAYTTWRITNIGNGTEAMAIDWVLTDAGAMAGNVAMTLTGAGVVAPDHSIMFGQSQNSAAVADQVSLGGFEISAGHRALAISSEEVVLTESVTSDRTLPVRINGATYKFCLKA